jgi:hypothetical protein
MLSGRVEDLGGGGRVGWFGGEARASSHAESCSGRLQMYLGSRDTGCDGDLALEDGRKREAGGVVE